MRVEFAPLALSDLESIAEYIAADNPRRAVSFVRELRAQCGVLGKIRCCTACGQRSAPMPGWWPSAAT
jgi:plasmid stabilization system protein ParE